MFTNSQFSFKIIFAIEVSNQLISVPNIISSVFSICNKCFISEIIRSILKLINELIGSPSKMSLISFKLCLTSFLLCFEMHCMCLKPKPNKVIQKLIIKKGGEVASKNLMHSATRFEVCM